MREIRMHQEIIVSATNEIGAMARVIRVLSDMGINLLSVVVKTDDAETAIHLITSSQSFARDALRKADFIVEERDVLVVELPHHPGFLCRVSEALARKEIAIDELYSTVPQEGRTGLVVLTCSNNERALQALRRHCH
ncbi:MAG: ACT domain-containing protein [Candidatus Bipolaricaulota bacterium]|nr:ACT domain-containing protein [Candidatus Bipolaricaulota bacterium]